MISGTITDQSGGTRPARPRGASANSMAHARPLSIGALNRALGAKGLLCTVQELSRTTGASWSTHLMPVVRCLC